MHTYIHIHTLIHIHIHTSCMDTVVLVLSFSSSCQTTINSGSSEIMNCDGPFLDYIHCTRLSVVVRLYE
jgi:hypothetical protein